MNGSFVVGREGPIEGLFLQKQRKKGEETQELAADGKKMLNALYAVGDTFLCAVKLSFKYCLQKLFPHP